MKLLQILGYNLDTIIFFSDKSKKH